MKRLLFALLVPYVLAGCGARVTTGEASSADGVPIRYEARGSGDPALVLVHGWTNTRGIWGVHPETLSRSHRVVALDLAGHGESGSGRKEWTVGAFGDDVAAVVEDLDLRKVVLVGFSMGGDVVVEAANRLPGRVVGIVLIDTLHDPDRPLSVEQAKAIGAQFRAAWGDTAFVRAFAFTPDAPDSLVGYVMGMMPAEPREQWFPILTAVAEWETNDLPSALGRVGAPVAAINTTRLPTNVDALRRYAPSFTVDTLAGVGHAGILLRRTGDFDRRLLALVDRFDSANRGPEAR